MASKYFESHWYAVCSDGEILLRFPWVLKDFIRKLIPADLTGLLGESSEIMGVKVLRLR